jgi:dCTP deaminase
VIDPFDEKFLEPATYDLRVGDRAAVSTASRPIDLTKDEWLILEPGAMAILQSREILTLSRQIAGRIGPKTALLRHGILAATGPQIDPGFKGRLIVNLINLSPRSFSLRYEDPFLSIEFHYLNEPPDRPYSGEYQGRTGLAQEELEILLAYQGPTLAEIYRGFGELRDNIRDIAALRPDLTQMTHGIHSEFTEIRKAIGGLAEVGRVGGTALSLSIQDFGGEEYEVLKPIPIVVQPEDGEFLASFFEANIHAMGPTDQEAYDSLRSLILDTYESLAEVPPSSLAAPAAHQQNVLIHYLRARP